MADKNQGLATVSMAEGFGVITMNHSRRLNCLSADLTQAILEGFDLLEEREVRAAHPAGPARGEGMVRRA